MKLLRGVAASLLWVVAGVVGLLGGLLSVTVLLLPVGIPLLMLAKKLFGYSVAVLVPGKVRHPASSVPDSVRDGADRLLGRSTSPLGRLRSRSWTKRAERLRKKAGRAIG